MEVAQKKFNNTNIGTLSPLVRKDLPPVVTTFVRVNVVNRKWQNRTELNRTFPVTRGKANSGTNLKAVDAKTLKVNFPKPPTASCTSPDKIDVKAAEMDTRIKTRVWRSPHGTGTQRAKEDDILAPPWNARNQQKTEGVLK